MSETPSQPAGKTGLGFTPATHSLSIRGYHSIAPPLAILHRHVANATPTPPPSTPGQSASACLVAHTTITGLIVVTV